MTTARALVVDDSKVIQFKLSKMLQSRGLGAHVAGSGAEALAFLKTHRPDFILMDYMMADIDGYEVTRRIVADPETTAIPVIICTGEDTAEARARAAETGARGFMVKPVDDAALDCLLMTLHANTPQGAAAPARIVTPAVERAPNEAPVALAQAAARDAVERALEERLAARLADFERVMQGIGGAGGYGRCRARPRCKACRGRQRVRAVCAGGHRRCGTRRRRQACVNPRDAQRHAHSAGGDIRSRPA